MPSLAAIPAVKPDKNAGLDVPESFKSVVTVVEKKCRNLEKRKVTKVLFRCLPTRVRSFPRQHEVVMPAFLNLGFKLQKFDFHLFSLPYAVYWKSDQSFSIFETTKMPCEVPSLSQRIYKLTSQLIKALSFFFYVDQAGWLSWGTGQRERSSGGSKVGSCPLWWSHCHAGPFPGVHHSFWQDCCGDEQRGEEEEETWNLWKAAVWTCPLQRAVYNPG